MAELLITSSLDAAPEGYVFERGLPRHVTIWQDFTLPDVHLDDFMADAGRIIEGFSPLEFIGLDDAQYGPENTIPVRRVMALGCGATAITLHAALGLAIAHHEGEVRNPEWAYTNFSPHMTYVDGRAIEEGEYMKLDSVELIQRVPEAPTHKLVRKVWELESA